mmetsp:Transcript_66352/g.194190  ORF Transcript_66352/g.194190 Transcript_66352/m.194190 type:complete len:1053 (-) Transcript_66352:57-3215(-)
MPVGGSHNPPDPIKLPQSSILTTRGMHGGLGPLTVKAPPLAPVHHRWAAKMGEVRRCHKCGLSLADPVCRQTTSWAAPHAERLALRALREVHEEEQARQKKMAAKKQQQRKEYGIGWTPDRAPRNAGPARKLGHDLAAQHGLCCLAFDEEARAVRIVEGAEPAACVNLEYLSLALQVRLQAGREPQFSLDPLDRKKDRDGSMQEKCFQPEWLMGTSLGEVMFQADYHLKELAMGEYEQPVVGMKSAFDFTESEGVDELWSARAWFIVKDAEVFMADGDILIPRVAMGVEARQQKVDEHGTTDLPVTRPDHPLVKYAQSFTENFDLIAERKSVVYRLRELAKASLLAKFLLESEVQLEESWLDLASEVDRDCCMEIPQLWNERCLTQIQVRDGRITDSAKLASSNHHGVYGGVKFGLDRFRLASSITSRPGLRAVPTAARAVMPSLSMSDVRSMGMLVASMQGRGAPPPEVAVEAAAPGAVARPSMALPSMALRGAAPMGAAPTRPGASTAQLARQMQGLLVSEPGLDGRRARLDVPSLHGVDLNLDKFDLEQAVRTGSQAASGELTGAGISKAFWASLEGGSDSIFTAEDRKFFREIFNPCLSDRRDEGEHFMPPDPSSSYVEKLRSLVEKEAKVRQQRKEHFFSSQFVASEPGPLFPYSWNPTCEIRSGSNQETATQGSGLQPRPEYLAQAGMFDHILKSSPPVFDKSTEDGLRFRMYKVGNLDLRTTQEHNGKEAIGSVFSVLPSMQTASSQRSVQEHEKITKATEYVEAALGVPSMAYRRSYVVLTTEEGSQILTEKLADGTVSWQENPEKLEDRNSFAKVIRSGSCSPSKKSTVTVSDIKAFKGEIGRQSSSHSASKHYAQGVFGRARGVADRRSSGFGSRASWHKGNQAKTIQKEARKEKLRAEINAKRASVERKAQAKLSTGSGKKVIDPIVVGSWDDWTYGEPMAFDEQSRCYSAELQMGSAGRESFQILCDSDWDLCLHPDEDDASAGEQRALCGPDSLGHGKNWTIGLRQEDEPGEGVVYRITLKVDAAGRAEAVAWERLGRL